MKVLIVEDEPSLREIMERFQNHLSLDTSTIIPNYPASYQHFFEKNIKYPTSGVF